MIRILLYILPVLGFSLTSVPSGAQVKFYVNADNKVIAVDGLVRLQYRIDNAEKVTQFIPPDFSSFEVIQGPEQTTGVTIVNGEMNRYVLFGFTLRPSRTGRFSFGPARAVADGSNLQSSSITIEVREQGYVPAITARERQNRSILEEFILKRNESAVKKISENVFVKLDVSKKSVYIGEPLIATYKLYTRVNSESRVISRPSLNGFSVFDMVDPESGDVMHEEYQGKDYNVYLLRKAQLYPLQEGEFELGSMEVENAVSFIKEEYAADENELVRTLRALGEEGIHPDAWTRETVSLSNQPIRIHVKPLPADSRPPAFNGAVGNFDIRAALQNTAIRKGDVSALTVTISGAGNLPIVSGPQINWPDSVETYETTINEELNKFSTPISGKKIFTIPFSPRFTGKYELPPIELCSFNPATGKYVTQTAGPLVIDVLPGGNEPKVKEKDNLKPVASPEKNNNLIIAGLLVLALMAILAGIYFHYKRKNSLKKPIMPFPQIEKAETDNPPPEAFHEPEIPHTLERAREFMETSQAINFYREIEMLIRYNLRNKFRIPVKESIENIRQELSVASFSKTDTERLAGLLQDCEMSIYTPVVLYEKMNTDYETASDLVSVINNFPQRVSL